MLEIINNLSPFFEDCYREYSVREYSRKINISPPTASKILKDFSKEGLLKMRVERGFILFRVNRESEIMKSMAIVYWKEKLKDLFDFINDEFNANSMILFGSLVKLECKPDSDIDIAIITKGKKKIDLTKFEKKLEREIQIFLFESIEKINKDLKDNIVSALEATVTKDKLEELKKASNSGI